MSVYYQPDEVERSGKPVSNKQMFRGNGKNKLVMVLDRFIFKTAADVTSDSEYEYFYQQYYSGAAVSYHLYDYTPSK